MEAKGAINEFTSTLFAVRLSPSIIYQSVNRYFLHPKPGIHRQKLGPDMTSIKQKISDEFGPIVTQSREPCPILYSGPKNAQVGEIIFVGW